ncbi:MAG: universal stress protein [Ginsengibacter sp.]
MPKNIDVNRELTLMVALDLTQMDAILLRYVSFLEKVWNIKSLYFTHNIKQSKLYNLYEDFLKEDIKLEQVIEQALKKSIDENYTGTIPHTLLITSDNYTEGILTHLAKEYKIDVVVTGNKDAMQGTGALSQKLVRMLQSHILLVPEETNHEIKKVLVPTDFSNDSARSFLAARSLVERTKGEIEALHIYDIPSFFFPYIDTEKAIDKTKKDLKNRFENFNRKHKLPEYIRFKYLDKEDLSVVETIEQEAEKGSFDIVVISARGGNNLTSLFIGSITNDLLSRNRKMPLLVVK